MTEASARTARRTTPGASAEAIQTHYDVGNRFYELWLDPTLTYSCALWDGEDDTLEAAQQRKLAYMADAALGAGARRVLDIGCGWGGLLRHFRTRGVAVAVGLTLSQAQHDFVEGLGLPGVEARLESWRDHRPASPYDAIVSAGAFEHFADLDLTEAERLGVYRDFFRRCHEWLRPGGTLTLQTIAYGPAPAPASRRRHFVEIFPESDLPWPAEIFKASEHLFEVTAFRNDRDHYIRTLKAWRRNLREARASALDEVGEAIFGFYERYLVLAAIAFGGRHAVLLRLRMTRYP
ncbi:MAG TPA: cyclopropane-fatty-acyl-phospholipid synthase family protein [Caulobacteraceae bacterium]|nr:cyclopropane-fatty-acyl-phospholipid synthase family protein [Caulobacteraceae bacterium]